MKYFSYIVMDYVYKNKLQKEVAQFLHQTQNRKIIDQADLSDFIKTINVAIEWANTKYPKCKPLNPDWQKVGIPDTDWRLGLPMITMHIYKEAAK